MTKRHHALQFAEEMKQKAMILSWILASLLSGCKEAEVEDTRSEYSYDRLKTDQEVAEFAREFVWSEQKWTDPIRTDPETGNYGPVALFAPRPEPGEIFLSTDPIFEDSQANITISSPFITEGGDCRATITNESAREIQIYPSACGVEILFGERIGTLIAKDPALVSLISLKIPSGEARDFSFCLIPGLTDLNGELRLFVRAVSTDPLAATIVKSESFEISDVKSDTKSKTTTESAKSGD